MCSSSDKIKKATAVHRMKKTTTGKSPSFVSKTNDEEPHMHKTLHSETRVKTSKSGRNKRKQRKNEKKL